jgi:transposase-like protein
MDTYAKRDDGANSERTRRRMRTLQEKQALVLEALQPGNSVAAVARKQ